MDDDEERTSEKKVEDSSEPEITPIDDNVIEKLTEDAIDEQKETASFVLEDIGDLLGDEGSEEEENNEIDEPTRESVADVGSIETPELGDISVEMKENAGNTIENKAVVSTIDTPSDVAPVVEDITSTESTSAAIKERNEIGDINVTDTHVETPHEVAAEKVVATENTIEDATS
jgi:hypothetical protein